MGQAKVHSREQWLWFDLDHCWEQIEEESHKREKQKRGYASSRQWRNGRSTHLAGLVGEAAYACFTGLSVDWKLKAEGDLGHEFRLPCGLTVDIKTVTHDDPILKHPYGEPMKARIYVLAHWRPSEHRAALVGEVMAEVFGAADSQSFGHGPQHSMHWTELWAFSTPEKVMVQQ